MKFLKTSFLKLYSNFSVSVIYFAASTNPAISFLLIIIIFFFSIKFNVSLLVSLVYLYISFFILRPFMKHSVTAYTKASVDSYTLFIQLNASPYFIELFDKAKEITKQQAQKKIQKKKDV